jgi:L-iditol 2-dehydrogenase
VLATDLMPERLAHARAFGATKTLRGDDPGLAEAMARWTRGRGLDAAVIAVPSDELVRRALEWVRGAGQVMVFAHTRRGGAMPLDLSVVCVDEKDVIGSYSSDVLLQSQVARLVFRRQRDVRRLVTHQFPLERTAEAVALAAQPRPDSLKVVVRPGGDE